jgi:hypothetical protein
MVIIFVAFGVGKFISSRVEVDEPLASSRSREHCTGRASTCKIARNSNHTNYVHFFFTLRDLLWRNNIGISLWAMDVTSWSWVWNCHWYSRYVTFKWCDLVPPFNQKGQSTVFLVLGSNLLTFARLFP